jgi:hypothetical protein
MARARNIKPKFFLNGELVELPFHTRLLFIGLWCLADREGRLEDRPKQIKMEIFPADDVNIDASLAELAAAGFITRYRICDRAYLQVVNFLKHQNPHHREPPSTIPATDAPRTESRPATEPSVNGKAEHGPGGAKPARRKSGEAGEGFAEFWAEYPKKVAKCDAIAAWNKLAPDAAIRETILADVRKRRQTPDWTKENRKYALHAATYLNGCRWEDELPANDAGADAEADQEVEHMRASGRRAYEDLRGTEGPR